MWPFKRKKDSENAQTGPVCAYCGSAHTVLKSSGAAGPDYVKVWRGQRYLTCHCLDCGRDFYTGRLPESLDDYPEDDGIVSDEDELLAAEEELRKQADEDDDHRFKTGF